MAMQLIKFAFTLYYEPFPKRTVGTELQRLYLGQFAFPFLRF